MKRKEKKKIKLIFGLFYFFRNQNGFLEKFLVSLLYNMIKFY